MSIEERVIDIVKDVLGMEGEKVTSEDTFEDLYIDSLDLVEIIIDKNITTWYSLIVLDCA